MPFITKEQVSKIRKELNSTFHNLKFSVVRRDYMCVDIAIMSGDVDFHANNDLNRVDKSVLQQYPELAEILSKVEKIANDGNGVEVVDGDYGTVPNYYVRVEVGRWDKPYVYNVKVV